MLKGVGEQGGQAVNNAAWADLYSDKELLVSFWQEATWSFLELLLQIPHFLQVVLLGAPPQGNGS